MNLVENEAKKFCAFVLMPFSSDFDDVYKIGIKEAAKKSGFSAQRVDYQQYISQTILEKIHYEIVKSDVIIADMTGKNANVFYEVGYAHAKNKPCILLTQCSDDIPFDLKHHKHIVYEKSLSKLRAQLIKELQWVKKYLVSYNNAIELFVEGYASIEWDVDTIAETTNQLMAPFWVKIHLVLNFRNKHENNIELSDYIFIYGNVEWDWRQNLAPCITSTSDDFGYKFRTSVFPPVRVLQSGKWTRVALEGRRQYGSVPIEKIGYLKVPLKGRILLRITTNKRIYDLPVLIEMDATGNIS